MLSPTVAIDNDTINSRYIKRLLLFRSLVSFLLFLVFYWFETYAGQKNFAYIEKLALLWVTFTFIHLVLYRISKSVSLHLLFQLASDVVLLGFIIYASGGFVSPFVFLLGLTMIAAGSQSRVLITLLITVLAVTAYIIAAYAYIETFQISIEPTVTLQILLQTSLFFLTGGIMAIIARRHVILQEKQAQASSEHQKLQKIHSQVLDSMQEGIVLLNLDQTIQTFNPAAAELLGLSPQHIGFKIHSFVKIPHDLFDFTHYGELGVFQHETNHHKHDLLITFKRVNDAKQSTWIMTLVDITQTRQLERQLAEQDKLASIGQMAAMLAHEIRNPMQTISQAVELMGLNISDNKLELIVTSEISRLNRLVSDMLDYANPLHPYPQLIDVEQVIQAAIQQVDLEKAFGIKANIDKVKLNIDPDHLRLVLDNLLRNALRASPQVASIEVIFTVIGKHWELSIRDFGDGIETSMKKKLFQPFQTGHKHGTGLGLATVWQVCHVNGWQVRIDEIITDGACFEVLGQIYPDLENAEANHG